MKLGQRYGVLFARGCWLTTGEHAPLAWLVAEKESEESWGDLLFAFKQRKLRTTSHLERENRIFRRRFRQAVLFHSQEGLEATVFQNHALRASLPPTS